MLATSDDWSSRRAAARRPIGWCVPGSANEARRARGHRCPGYSRVEVDRGRTVYCRCLPQWQPRRVRGGETTMSGKRSRLGAASTTAGVLVALAAAVWLGWPVWMELRDRGWLPGVPPQPTSVEEDNVPDE